MKYAGIFATELGFRFGLQDFFETSLSGWSVAWTLPKQGNEAQPHASPNVSLAVIHVVGANWWGPFSLVRVITKAPVLLMAGKPLILTAADKVNICGVVADTTSVGGLASVIIRAASGKSYDYSHIRPMEEIVPNGGRPLSCREKEMLFWLASGLSIKQTGFLLGITESTVDLHRTNIKRKLGARNVAEQTRWAIRLGVYVPE